MSYYDLLGVSKSASTEDIKRQVSAAVYDGVEPPTLTLVV